MRGKVDHSNNILLASSQRTFSFDKKRGDIEKIEEHETECAMRHTPTTPILVVHIEFCARG